MLFFDYLQVAFETKFSFPLSMTNDRLLFFLKNVFLPLFLSFCVLFLLTVNHFSGGEKEKKHSSVLSASLVFFVLSFFSLSP